MCFSDKKYVNFCLLITVCLLDFDCFKLRLLIFRKILRKSILHSANKIQNNTKKPTETGK